MGFLETNSHAFIWEYVYFAFIYKTVLLNIEFLVTFFSLSTFRMLYTAPPPIFCWASTVLLILLEFSFTVFFLLVDLKIFSSSLDSILILWCVWLWTSLCLYDLKSVELPGCIMFSINLASFLAIIFKWYLCFFLLSLWYSYYTYFGTLDSVSYFSALHFS